MIRVLQKLLLITKELCFKIILRIRFPKLLLREYRYYSQFESKALVDKFIKKEISVINDPLWNNSGAKSKKEYLNWSWNACGMACLKMIIYNRENKEYAIVDLGKGCEDFGGYKVNISDFDVSRYLTSIDGLYYNGFIAYIKNKFGLTGRIKKNFGIYEIIYNFALVRDVIVSVSPAIRDKNNLPKTKGGHLVLITGYDLIKKKIYIHNPSGLYKFSQENYSLTFTEFQKIFAARGIVIE